MNNYFYLAKPVYGGWVTFSAHLLLKNKVSQLFKISNRFENKTRPFGYGILYQNVTEQALDLPNTVVLCLDKNYYHLIPKLMNSTIIIHDPTEIKEDVLPLLKSAKIITIRKTVQDFLKNKHNIESTLKLHPFVPYPLQNVNKKVGAVSISRVDFDKHTEIILEANKLLKKPIKIFGAINRLYEHLKLKDLNLSKYYKGTFDKSFDSISNILSPTKFMVDMSLIKYDGGGTQYTFLEAIHNKTALILQRKWVNVGDDFKEGYNCLAVDTPEELVEILNKNPNVDKIIQNATKLLSRHVNANWK